MKPINIHIHNYRLFYAASLASADKDVRFFMLGTLIQKAPKQCGGGLVYMATDGKKLTIAYDDLGTATNIPKNGVILQADNDKGTLPKSNFAIKALLNNNDGVAADIVFDKKPSVSVESIAKMTGTMTIPNLDKQITVHSLDSRFPHFVEVVQNVHANKAYDSIITTEILDVFNSTAKVFTTKNAPGAVYIRLGDTSNRDGKDHKPSPIMCNYYSDMGNMKLPIYTLLMPLNQESPPDELPDFIKCLKDSVPT